MSLLYNRTILIARQEPVTGGGVQPYSGSSVAKETTIFSGIIASIQEKSTGQRPDADMPANAANRTFWRVFIPLSQGITQGSVLRGDIVTDDVGQRYQVTAPYINFLGPNFLVERLEA